MDVKLQSNRPHGHLLFAFVIFSAALVLRLLHVFFTVRHNPMAGDLALDAAIYDRWARAIVTGSGSVPTRLMQAPLYPWLMSAFYRLPVAPVTAVRVLQAVLGAGSCLLVYSITAGLFRSKTACIVAGASAALYLPFIFHEGVLVPATLILFLNLLLVYLLIPLERPPGTGRTFAAGIVLGLSVMAKPVALLLFPFAILHLIFASRIASGRAAVGNEVPAAGEADGNPEENANSMDTDRGQSHIAENRPVTRGRRGTATGIAAFSAGLLIAVSPLPIRNAVMTGGFIPLTTGGGINYYIGNNPRATGYYHPPQFKGETLGATPGEQWRRMYSIASGETGREIKPSEISGFWFKRGLEYNLSEPGRWADLLWRKTLFFFNDYERANVESFNFHRRFGGILGLPLLTFGIVAPLALMGIFLTRERWRRLWLLYGGISAYLLSALAFYVTARYRLPAVPLLLPFAGMGIVELVRLFRRRTGEAVLLTVALVFIYIFSNSGVAADTRSGTSANLTRLGNSYVARGDSASAVEAFAEAIRTNPLNEEAVRGLKKLRGKGRIK